MITFVLGGAASGKSAVAETLASERAAGAPVAYLATAVITDDDMAARVVRHRARRPGTWTTEEVEVALPAALGARPSGVVLVDSLGTWVAAHRRLDPDVDALVRALAHRRGDSIVVSDEVGLGVHPETPVGRNFRDVLGTTNAAVAAVADEVLFVVAGRVLRL